MRCRVLSERAERTDASRGAGGGFTLVELLVAIGVVGLIAIGITQVFSLTSQTVSQGRRLSNLTQTAGLLERQLREDVARMSRKGFLVIRNAYADVNGDGAITWPSLGAPGPDAVPVREGDTRPRPRRVDELLFFAEGEFQSVREPRHPQRLASSREARIYYGHGLRQRPVNDVNQTYLAPRLTDDNPRSAAPYFGEEPGRGESNPNRYAADWTLLRHVTLLARPEPSPAGSLNPAPTSGQPLFGINRGRMEDSARQIGLQPAAQSVFRSLARNSAWPAGQELLRNQPGPSAQNGPRFASGLVDIATTDLAEVRAIVLTAPPVPSGTSPLWEGPVNNPAQSGLPPQNRPSWLRSFVGGDVQEEPWPNGPTRPSRVRMQRWMMDALPADSDGRDATAPYAAGDPSRATRMRHESRPPDLLDVAGRARSGSDLGLTPDAVRADQLALVSSGFAPRCVEFIVEWSFGVPDERADPADSPTVGRPVWHGLQRLVDVNGNGVFDDRVDFGVRPYPFVFTNGDGDPSEPVAVAGSWALQPFRQVYRLTDGTRMARLLPRELIHPDLSGARNPALGPVLYSLFGYVDPTFAPELPLPRPTNNAYVSPVTGTQYPTEFAFNADVLRLDVNPPPAVPPASLLARDVTFDPNEGDLLRDPMTIEWPWPAFIRVTVTLADPIDASVQQTFQIVVPVRASEDGAM
jgi:type II secretory pathway pseudopilin PulG